jgi:hypothetical protein
MAAIQNSLPQPDNYTWPYVDIERRQPHLLKD